MIKFENTNVMNFEGALRGMRNPLNSWDKSDSGFGCRERTTWGKVEKCNLLCEDCGASYDSHNVCSGDKTFIIGDNDLALAQKLIRAGSDHRKFLRQIFVSVDITAPLYWWKEFDTYKVATVANSCSTMHKIHSKPIELSDFSIDDFTYTIHFTDVDFKQVFKMIISECEYHRKKYLETKDKKHWRALIQLLPESYNQKRTVTLNYETLRNIYGSRRNHKLDEWSVDFMGWIDSLPYAEELIKFQ